MQDNGRNSNESIENILEALAGNGTADEFILGTEPASSGLVFENATEDTLTDEDKSEEKTNIKFEAVEETPQKDIEFSIPEEFEVNEKYNTPVKDEFLPRVAATYVPRFTGAADSYRMSNDVRPKYVKPAEVNKEPVSDIDPTAEIDENVKAEEVKQVSVNKQDNDELESASKVFKFVENELPPEEINTSVEEPLVEDLSKAEQEPHREENAYGQTEYSIPDPDDMKKSVVDYAAPSAVCRKIAMQEATGDIGDGVEDNGGKGADYKTGSKRDSVKDGFLDGIMSLRVRFFVALAITLLLLVTESMFAFGVDIPHILNLATVPGAMALIDLQFVLCLYLISIPETVRAVKFLLKRSVSPELYVTVSFAVIIAYTTVIAINSPRKYSLFGLLFAITVLASIGAAYFRKIADFSAFKRISVSGEKTVIDNKKTRTLERENAALDGVVEEHKSRIMRLFRTMFVPGFFKKAEEETENTLNVCIVLASSLGAALVTAFVAFFVFDGWLSAACAFALVFMVACPAMSIMIHKLPYYYAVREAEAENSAVIGESSLYGYSGIDVITFNDTEVFGREDVTLQRIMLYGRSDNLTKALRQMSALFMNVGGPLDCLFSDALDRKSSPADKTFVEDGGISGEIGDVSVLAGTMEYMLEKGVKIPEDEGKKIETVSDSTKIMYAAENGEVYAKFYIRYSFSEEFSMLLPTLDDEGIKCLVYTRDPNITNELIRTLTAGTDKIRVLKKYSLEESDNVLYRSVSGGMVTCGDKNNAINMILLAKRYAKFQTRLATTELLAMTVGGALAVVLSLGGMSLVPSVALAVWQIAWCGVLHFISRKTFRILNDTKGN